MGDLHHWFPIIPIQHDQYHDLDYHLRSTILRQIRLNKEYIQAYTYLYLPIFTIYLSFFLSLSIYNTNFQTNSSGYNFADFHPSWLSYFSERWLNHQPLYNSWWSHFLRGGGCPAHAARSGGAAGVEDMGELHQLVSRNQLIRILKTMVISRVFTCYISYILWHPKGKIRSLLGHIILYPKN